MIRTLAIAAIAAAFASNAAAAEIRVPVSGKSAVQIEADVETAVRRVCMRAVEAETLKLDAYARCVDNTLDTILASLPNSQRLAER